MQWSTSVDTVGVSNKSDLSLDKQGNGLYTVYAVKVLIKNIVVYTVIGDVVLEKSINNLPNTPLDISNLAKGGYYIKVISATGEINIEKLIYQ
jgi:hypothetical protein